MTKLASRFAGVADRLKNIDAPVLVQEMRVRQRGMKPFAVMLAYLLILSVAAMLVLYFDYPSGSATADRMSQLGRELYGTLTVVQLIMVSLIVPAYSSASISGERERGTFDLLSLTLLSSSAIVAQKLAAALGQALMLVFASLPVMAIVFLLGGVSPMELLVSYGLLLVTAVFLGSLGMACSSCLRSSKTSTFVAYLITFCLFLGLPIGSLWLQSMSYRSSYGSSGIPLWVSVLIFAFAGAVGSVMIYAPLSLFLGRKRIWKSRVFRISIFGAVYLILMLIVTSPNLAKTVLTANNPQNLPLSLYINPFAAFLLYMDAHYGGSMSSTAYWAMGITAGFFIGCTVIFRYASSARLAGLRSS